MKFTTLCCLVLLTACSTVPESSVQKPEPVEVPVPNLQVGQTPEQAVALVDTVSKCMVVHNTMYSMAERDGDVNRQKYSVTRLRVFQIITASLYGLDPNSSEGLNLAFRLMDLQLKGMLAWYEYEDTPIEERQVIFKSIVNQCESIFLKIVKQYEKDNKTRQPFNNPFSDKTFL